MRAKGKVRAIMALMAVAALLASLFATATVAQAATPQPIKDSIDKGLEWLAGQQDPADWSWGAAYGYRVGHTGLAVLKFEHHAVFGLGVSPFDPGYKYHVQVEKGLDFLFSMAQLVPPPLTSPWGDPDPDGDGAVAISEYGDDVYEVGIAMMAIAASNAPARVVNVAGSAVNTWTYSRVLQDMVDWMAWAQTDDGAMEGGWRYAPNEGDSDNSVSGWAALGLGYAAAPPPWGFGLTVPAFVKTELNKWIAYIQNPVDGDAEDGGSGYTDPFGWVNIYKTGNLLYEMALVGDTAATPRVQAAVAYLVRHWNDADQDPGWKGDATTSQYQATLSVMKGLEALGINTIDGIDWFKDFTDAIVAEQIIDSPSTGHWQGSSWGNPVLDTAWAMLTMQKAVPPPRLALTPVTATNPLNSSHLLTARLVDANNQPVPGETITFTVTAGPHAGKTGTGVTDANGQATWSYTGTIPGDDTIVATGAGVTSNEAKKSWAGAPPAVPGMTEWGIIGTVAVLGGLMLVSLRRRTA